MEPINVHNAADAARAYTDILGWPIAVGYRYRPRQGCTCERADCPTPGAHPVLGPLDFPGKGTLVPQLETAPGAGLIAPTTRFDALVVPYRTGAAAMATLDRIASVPCLVDATHAVLLVMPATGRYALSPGLPIEVRSGPEQWIALPPAQGIHWDTHP